MDLLTIHFICFKFEVMDDIKLIIMEFNKRIIKARPHFNFKLLINIIMELYSKVIMTNNFVQEPNYIIFYFINIRLTSLRILLLLQLRHLLDIYRRLLV